MNDSPSNTTDDTERPSTAAEIAAAQLDEQFEGGLAELRDQVQILTSFIERAMEAREILPPNVREEIAEAAGRLAADLDGLGGIAVSTWELWQLVEPVATTHSYKAKDSTD